jgi:surfeit locus 1 family protein
MFPVLVSLGCWQLDRAGQKRELYEKSGARENEAILDLNTAGSKRQSMKEMLWRRVTATGRFDTRSLILLDNQIHHGKAGYFVFSPFRLPGEEKWLLVNRGWIPADADRNTLPGVTTPSEEITLSARVTDVPATGLFLGNEPVEVLPGGILRAQRINAGEITALLRQNLLPYILRLEPESPHGFDREWVMPGSGEEKHLGYAFQWFALSATLLVIYFAVNLKKHP